jgi:lipopolysaccharide transport system ATP-binding protein
VGLGQFYEEPLKPGAIYPAMYVSRPRFDNVLSPQVNLAPETYQPSRSDGADVRNWYNFVVRKEPVIKFVVIRDLRDTLVSLYFSLKVSHKIISENVADGRQILNETSEEDGLLFLIDERGRASANIQHSWLQACRAEGDVRLFRYEDLIANEQQEFARIIEYCQIEIAPQKLSKIVDKNSFSNLAGRKPGEEDISSHYRKGISGDWKNHFTDRIKTEFKQKFGQLLIDTGYEKDMNW